MNISECIGCNSLVEKRHPYGWGMRPYCNKENHFLDEIKVCPGKDLILIINKITELKSIVNDKFLTCPKCRYRTLEELGGKLKPKIDDTCPYCGEPEPSYFLSLPDEIGMEYLED